MTTSNPSRANGATADHSRLLSGIIGVTAIAAATRLTLSHAAAGDPFSPVGSALAIFGAVTVACAIVAPAAWRDGRRALAGLICVAALAGEAFGLAATVERLASERAERQRAASSGNVGRTLAVEHMTIARTELADAVRRAADATRGGCKTECEALRTNEAAARDRLATAEGAVAKMHRRWQDYLALIRRLSRSALRRCSAWRCRSGELV
jgi:hypothetical protein